MGVITHPEVRRELVQEVVQALSKKTSKIFFDPLAASKAHEKATLVRSMDVDLAVVLGGDGTLLWSVGELPNNPLILGINTGRVGYLAEIHANDESIRNAIERVFSGRYLVDTRSKLRINSEYEVLNEVVVLPQKPATLLEIRLSIGDAEPSDFRADGVLVCTQTGSTGHSLSLGGPIIHPQARVYLVSPMSPYMKEQPPIVVPDSVKTTIGFPGKKRDALMVLDGNIVKKIPDGGVVRIEKSRNTTRFVRFGDSKWKIKPERNRNC